MGYRCETIVGRSLNSLHTACVPSSQQHLQQHRIGCVADPHEEALAPHADAREGLLAAQELGSLLDVSARSAKEKPGEASQEFASIIEASRHNLKHEEPAWVRRYKAKCFGVGPPGERLATRRHFCGGDVNLSVRVAIYPPVLLASSVMINVVGGWSFCESMSLLCNYTYRFAGGALLEICESAHGRSGPRWQAFAEPRWGEHDEAGARVSTSESGSRENAGAG